MTENDGKKTNKQDELLDHNYDGIQEYDNDLPKWWVWLFIVTVVWGLGYAVWFHFTGRPTPTEQLALDMKAIESLKAAKAASVPVGSLPSNEQMLVLASDASVIARGSATFTAKCAVCHAAAGQGLIGPNLTDNRWIHGGTPDKVRLIIEQGVLAKGMLAWKGVITDQEITDVVAYVMSLRGTKPPNPKAAEGEFVVE